jgi:starvation-inducible outer membrane lipoprotein
MNDFRLTVFALSLALSGCITAPKLGPEQQTTSVLRRRCLLQSECRPGGARSTILSSIA